jgi:hypothetical protein
MAKKQSWPEEEYAAKQVQQPQQPMSEVTFAVPGRANNDGTTTLILPIQPIKPFDGTVFSEEFRAWAFEQPDLTEELMDEMIDFMYEQMENHSLVRYLSSKRVKGATWS